MLNPPFPVPARQFPEIDSGFVVTGKKQGAVAGGVVVVERDGIAVVTQGRFDKALHLERVAETNVVGGFVRLQGQRVAMAIAGIAELAASREQISQVDPGRDRLRIGGDDFAIGRLRHPYPVPIPGKSRPGCSGRRDFRIEHPGHARSTPPRARSRPAGDEAPPAGGAHPRDRVLSARSRS